jgi:hypothetical protein
MKDYHCIVEKIVRKFQSHAAAEQADTEYYRSLKTQHRLDLLLDLLRQVTSNEAEQGFARVYRITKLHANKHATGRAQDLADLKRIEDKGD